MARKEWQTDDELPMNKGFAALFEIGYTDGARRSSQKAVALVSVEPERISVNDKARFEFSRLQAESGRTAAGSALDDHP